MLWLDDRFSVRSVRWHLRYAQLVFDPRVAIDQGASATSLGLPHGVANLSFNM